MAALASDWLRHFRLLLWNGWTEFNETSQEARSQCPLPSLCFLGRSEKKMATLASDLLRPFWLFLWNRLTEFKETWQEAKSQRPLPSLCFSGQSGKQDGRSSLWLAETFSASFWNRWSEFKETWQEARSQCPLPSLCFSCRSEKQNGCPSLWLAETFSASLLKPLNGIQTNLTGSKISMSSTKFVFLGPIVKTKWLSGPLIGWNIFDFSSVTAERNRTKLNRKQDLNVLYQVCVFRADQKNKMAAQLLICRDIFVFSSETTEQSSMKLDRKQDLNVLYQVCDFQVNQKNKMATHFWLAETFWTSHLKLLKGIKRNLTGSKISMSSNEFVFFMPMNIQKWQPWLICQKGGTLY